MSKYKNWTPEEEINLEKLIKAGQPIPDIALILNRTQDSVRFKIKRVEIKSKNYPKQTLCWECRNATNSKCSWSRSLTPVDGWKAREMIKKCDIKGKSYIVMECPLFCEG